MSIVRHLCLAVVLLGYTFGTVLAAPNLSDVLHTKTDNIPLVSKSLAPTKEFGLVLPDLLLGGTQYLNPSG